MQQRQFEHLNGLRGLAALIVVIDHFFLAFLPKVIVGPAAQDGLHIYGTPLYLFVNGDLSVCIFLILSAFVLSAKFFRTGDPVHCLTGAIKRFPRLGIPVVGSVMIAYVLMASGAMKNTVAGAHTGAWLFTQFYCFTPSFWGAVAEAAYKSLLCNKNTYNPVLWTLHIELIGSLSLFAVIAFVGKLPRRNWIYGALALASCGTYYLAFVIGVFFADVCRGAMPLSTKRSNLLAWLVLPAAIFIGCFPASTVVGTPYSFVHFPLLNEGQTRILCHVLGSVGIFALMLYSPVAMRFFSLPVMRWLGKQSFALYLLHFPILCSFSSGLYLLLLPAIGAPMTFIATTTISLGVILLSCMVFEKFVDRNAIKLADLLASKLGR